MKTNMLIRFMLPWTGDVIHSNSTKTQVEIPQDYELRANILGEHDGCWDLEVVEPMDELIASQDWLSSVPLLVLAVHQDDVKRVMKTIAASN